MLNQIIGDFGVFFKLNHEQIFKFFKKFKAELSQFFVNFESLTRLTEGKFSNFGK